MPIRIKPTHDLGPCILTLEDIKEISNLVESQFSTITYSAQEGAWEIYDELSQPFIAAISQRRTLDSLSIMAKSDSGEISREIVLKFNDVEAKIICTAAPEDEIWFEHFLLDLKKHIRRPSFAQFRSYGRSTRQFQISLVSGGNIAEVSPWLNAPYCRIIIQQRPPNPMVENIKANLISNAIWAILLFILGIVTTLVAQGLLHR